MLGLVAGAVAIGIVAYEFLKHTPLPWKPSAALADTSHDPPAIPVLASSGIKYNTFTWPAKAAPGLTYTLAIPVSVSGGAVVPPVPWVSYSNTQSTGLRLLQAMGGSVQQPMQQQVMRDFGVLAQ